ncbi:MAG TPA: hypothetical protein VF881_18235, partial [Polyangiaceae bacterium]
MSRASSRERKRITRNLEELEKGLARNDLERAVTAFLRLAEDDRARWMDKVERLVQQEVERARAAERWRDLAAWAVLAEREPR